MKNAFALTNALPLSVSRQAGVRPDATRQSRDGALPSDDSPEVIKLFKGVHASKGFSLESAHKAFAGVKRKK